METIATSPRKLLHFDENELRARSMITRDYGHMNIWEAKTPFPRRGEAIAAKTLRQRLLELLDQSSSSKNSASSEAEDMAVQRKVFTKKRKDLSMHEFNITRNKLNMPLEHESGPSIKNWRIVDTVSLSYDFNDDENNSLKTYQSFENTQRRSNAVKGFQKKLLNTSVLGHPTLLDAESKKRNRKKAAVNIKYN